ncbi:MAG: hypothetical protein R6V58_16490, partial [Planctomycetota bacterium]
PILDPTQRYDMGCANIMTQQRDSSDFEYSDADLVTMIQYPDATVNYFHYDAQLRRCAVRDSAGLSYFTWDADGLCPLAERDAAGAVVAEHSRGYAPIRGIGDLAGSRLVAGGATYYQYPAFDHRGNVVGLTDGAGAASGRFEYDAWGTKLRDDPPPEGTRFGQSAPAWLDLPDSGGELGLSPFRLYHKPTGRFLQRDRIGPPGEHFYAALADNPCNQADPEGLKGIATGDQAAALEKEVRHELQEVFREAGYDPKRTPEAVVEEWKRTTRDWKWGTGSKSAAWGYYYAYRAQEWARRMRRKAELKTRALLALQTFRKDYGKYVFYWLTGLGSLVSNKLQWALRQIDIQDYRELPSETMYSGRYNALWNTLALEWKTDRDVVLHEAVHAYNDFVDKHEAAREDEGLAYAAQFMARAVVILRHVEQELSKPQPSPATLETHWRSAWRIIARVVGAPGAYGFWEKDFDVGVRDVQRVGEHLGFQISCRSLSAAYTRLYNLRAVFLALTNAALPLSEDLLSDEFRQRTPCVVFRCERGDKGDVDDAGRRILSLDQPPPEPFR